LKKPKPTKKLEEPYNEYPYLKAYFQKHCIYLACLPLKRIQNPFKSSELSQVLVVHACNPSYSGGRDQEGSRLKFSPET
jgi:hypothetical protein